MALAALGLGKGVLRKLTVALLLLSSTQAFGDFDPVELRGMLHGSVGFGVTMLSFGAWKALGVTDKPTLVLLSVATGVAAAVTKNLVEHFTEQERLGARGVKWMSLGAGAAGVTLLVLPF